MSFKLYMNINDIPPISEVIEFDNTPIFPDNGLSIGDDVSASFTVKLSNKSFRNFKRAFFGTNNYRKLHGLPMYRRRGK